MNGIVKTVTIIFIIFGIGQIGFEAFRFYRLHSMLQGDMRLAATDSLELAMLDEYRHDKVSIIDEAVCRDMFIEIIKKKYRLDDSLTPIGDSYIQGPMVFETIDTEAGQFHIGADDIPVMDVPPSIRVNGYITVKPIILGVNTTYKIPFRAESENRRYN